MNSKLSSILNPVLLVNTPYLSSNGTYNYSCDWKSYYYLLIYACDYSNPEYSCLIPTTRFAQTSAGNRPMWISDDFTMDAQLEIYQQSGANGITVRKGGAHQYLRVEVYGIGRK